MIVLAGDLGGTKTLLQIVEPGAPRPRELAKRHFSSADYPGLLPMVQEFLGDLELDSGVLSACFGVAGPVTGVPGSQVARITNLGWKLDSVSLSRALGIPQLRLLNDFEAIGYGIEGLAEHDLVTLQTGSMDPTGTRAVLGAGTGLGEALLVPSGAHYTVVATEGGHADFAPIDQEQTEMVRHMRRTLPRVSCESVLSGPGLVRVFSFLSERERPSAELIAAMESGDAAAAIGEFGLSERDRLARRALELFVRVYGAQAGNLALQCKATGGVYVAGGIAPKIVDLLRAGPFLAAFRNKPPMEPLLSQIPLHVVVNPEVGLLGAALVASRSLTP